MFDVSKFLHSYVPVYKTNKFCTLEGILYIIVHCNIITYHCQLNSEKLRQ